MRAPNVGSINVTVCPSVPSIDGVGALPTAQVLDLTTARMF